MHIITLFLDRVDSDKYLLDEAIEALVRLFNVDREGNIPTLYSLSALACSALLIAIITLATRQSGKSKTAHWMILFLAFVYLAIDEFVQLHEMLNTVGRVVFDIDSYAIWVVFAMIPLTIFIGYFTPFLISLRPQTRYLFILAGGIFVSGAIGFEVLGVAFFDADSPGITFFLIQTFEELFEMLGIAIFIYALLIYISWNLDDVVILTNKSDASVALPDSVDNSSRLTDISDMQEARL